MIAVVDYGVGNLYSLCRSLESLDLEACVTGDHDKIDSAEGVILPGVGAFGDAMNKLREAGLAEVIKQVAGRGIPLLGICLGMQLLFKSSEEFGRHSGLGLLDGRVIALRPELSAGGFNYKVPHMGWNRLRFVRPSSPLLKYSSEGEFVYYVHSYRAVNCEDCLVADSDYGVMVPGIVQQDNLFGVQFHPEKSGEAGLRMLKAFSEVPVC